MLVFSFKHTNILYASEEEKIIKIKANNYKAKAFIKFIREYTGLLKNNLEAS